MRNQKRRLPETDKRRCEKAKTKAAKSYSSAGFNPDRSSPAHILAKESPGGIFCDKMAKQFSLKSEAIQY